MSNSPQMRKGTKSCTECRRRKLRCSWTTEKAQRCRRCEERNLECLAQTASVSKGKKLSSKDRIGRLESRINQLTQALTAFESRIPHVPPEQQIPAQAFEAQSAVEVSDDQDTDDEDVSERDDIIVQDDQHGMRGLFQNEWLEAISPKSPEARSSKLAQASEDSDLALAKVKLQALIPDKEDVLVLAGHVTGWSRFVAAMFPSFMLPPNEDQIIATYDLMKTPSADVWFLANWLLVLALCAQQVPQDSSSPGQLLQSMRKRYVFANAVADTAEATLLSHDRLLGTVQGLETSPSYLRVMMTRGRVQKAWLYLRRVVSVAEFMGLPRLARAYELQNIKEGRLNGDNYRYAKLWVSLCVIDRIISTLNGLPVATRLYALPTMPEARMTTDKQPLDHFIKLSDLAMDIQDLEEGRLMTAYQNHYSAILKIDTDLHNLASTVPSSWNIRSGTEISRADIVTFMHNAITLQLHVRFVLKENGPHEDYTHSKIVGLQTCQVLTTTWRRMREALPFGFFLFAIMDLQAFTAIVTMMLVSATSHSERAFQHLDRDLLASQVEETLQLFEHNARKPYSSKFLRKATATLQNLKDLLAGNSASGLFPGIALAVPMLGKVHVRRAVNHQQRPTSKHRLSSAGEIEKSMQAAMQPESYEAFSWMVEEDGDTLFQDYLMMDDNDEWLQSAPSSV